MRIALHNPYFGKLVAETELARRISLAATRLGWQAREFASSTEINQFVPDLVICLHFRQPKLTQYPTYGCFWDPPAFFESDPQFVKNILSYDGYLSASNLLDQWLKDTYYQLPKPIEILPFYPGCNATPYVAPDFEQARLAYIGSNWDGSRFQELFLGLEQTGYLNTYGSSEGWAYLKSAYRGMIPFDGTSLLNVLRQAGVGLCLHRDEHRQAQVPTMRIFEIVASGAIAICAEHPFIRENFGDRVLYLQPNQSVTATVQQIREQIQWIQANPVAARELSSEAHKHFTEHLTLEKLLANLLPHHQTLVQKQQLMPTPPIHLSSSQAEFPSVQLIVRVNDRSLPQIQRALDSLAQQTYPSVGAIVVQHPTVEGLDSLLATYRDRLPIQQVYSPDTPCRSSPLWAGINGVSSKYFGILNAEDAIHPTHVASLVSLLEEFDQFGVAYAGSIRIWETENQFQQGTDLPMDFPAEPAALAYFDSVHLPEFLQIKNTIPSNSFLARTSLLDRFLKQDPQLNGLEDFFLLLNLLQRTPFIFSYQVTCEYYQSFPQPEKTDFHPAKDWHETRQRISRIMQYQPFPLHQTWEAMQREAGHPEIIVRRMQDVETHYLGRIQAMESSKFWQLRRVWFRVKRAIGLKDSDP